MNPQTDEKPNAKTLMRAVIDAQPEDASYEEILRELAFERMIERGLTDVRAGRTLSHEDALKRIGTWQR